MKQFFIILGIFLFGICVNATEIGVLPVGVSNTNAYGFENTSKIIAKEIVAINKNFMLENQNQSLKFKNLIPDRRKTVNLRLIKSVSASNKTLVITSYITSDNNAFDVWDILKISTDFGIEKPYTMEVKAVLTDNIDGVILWQKTYEQPLGVLKAKNIPEAFDKKEKITSYARNIISQDIVQNISLRLNPKNIDYASRIPQSTGSQEGIGLKYKNNAPVVKITPADDESFEERWRNDDSFNL